MFHQFTISTAAAWRSKTQFGAVRRSDNMALCGQHPKTGAKVRACQKSFLTPGQGLVMPGQGLVMPGQGLAPLLSRFPPVQILPRPVTDLTYLTVLVLVHP
jgi:hypothetical protein